jgi:hypothetical protein
MTTAQEDLRTIPVSQDSVPDLDKMVKLTKTYKVSGEVTTLYAAGRATLNAIDSVEPLFFKTPHGKRETVSNHRSGFIVSSTDTVARLPVRRRAAYLLVYGENDQRWMTWRVGMVSSIAQGKRLIDKILETGILPE